ncbi:MAG: hypothetical protein OEM38_11365 [Gammaproteobacteria bacterium]|nr:hypothetical protein [Gammaproteobacteria bacterium]
MSLSNKEITKNISELFNHSSSFQVLLQATQSRDIDSSSIDILTYLNSIHPYYIHIVEENELSYLNLLSGTEQDALINRLVTNHASHIIFTDKNNIPTYFLSQNIINIVLFTDKKQSAYQYLLRATENIPLETTSIHGCMVIAYNQGILITGESGAGKSTLLLALLDRGHLWIADDAPNIYRNPNGQVIVEHTEHLPEYIHIKDIGPINVDKTIGKAKRIPRHTLAAIIHLSNNAVVKKSAASIFNVYETINILGKTIPKWCISKNQENRALLVESIAKQLILNSWGDNASNTLIEAHDTAITAQQNET